MSTDALSDVLSAVHLSGSVFFDVTAKSPWVAEAPPAAQIANEVTPGAQHAIEYHVVVRGSCWISLVGDTGFKPVRLDAGDIAVIPHGDPHVVSSSPGMRAEPNLDVYRRPQDANALPFTLRTGGDGPSDVHLICGFFSCDARPFNPLLDSLPRFIRFGRDASQASQGLLEQFIRFATAEMGNKRAGSKVSSTGFRNCCSLKSSGYTWISWRKTTPAGLRDCEIRWSAVLWRCCTHGLPIPGRWRRSHRKPARHAPHWRTGLLTW
jgi:hypothetical protein